MDKVESGERGLLRLPMLERVAEVLHISVKTLTDTTETRQAKHCLDVFEIAAIRSAVQSYQAISRVFVSSAAEITEPPDLDRLTQQVNYAWTVFQNAHWPLLGRTLPQLLTTAQTAVAAYPGADDQARRARSLLSQAYQVTASTLYKLREFNLAWLAAERGFVLAEETGDKLLIERFTAFGPTNVRVHQIPVLLDLGDGARAVNTARQVTPDDLSRLPKERRAAHYLNVARGHRPCPSTGVDSVVILTPQALKLIDRPVWEEHTQQPDNALL